MDYRQLDNDELPQLWVERFQPVGEAKVALQEEISRRGIRKEAEGALDRRVEPPKRLILPLPLRLSSTCQRFGG